MGSGVPFLPRRTCFRSPGVFGGRYRRLPGAIREQTYAVLATAPGLSNRLTTEVALIWLMSGECTVVHRTAKAKVLDDDPIHSASEAVARDCFAFRTAENLRPYWEAR
jgi:hypothetical protein